MDRAGDRVFIENSGEGGFIAGIGFVERQLFAGNLLHAFQRLSVAVRFEAPCEVPYRPPRLARA